MERIILIETSTSLCSVALAENGEITAYKESSAQKAHASLTAVFIEGIILLLMTGTNLRNKLVMTFSIVRKII